MAEIPKLVRFFLLTAVAISVTVPGVETHNHFDIQVQITCTSRPNGDFPDYLGCVPDCVYERSLCSPYCRCRGGKQRCNIFSKECFCSDGLQGDTCNESCSSGYYGRNCGYRCRCKNNATCNRINGECTCTAGYQGSLCEEKCPKGTHGYQCYDECKCQNDAICHHVDGSCDCTAGWMGSVCAEPCLKGTYGKNCSETCDCFKNGPCNATTGDCMYSEDMFQCDCGINSSSEVNKANDTQENTSVFNEKNSCLPGFSGTNCENRDCPDNKWGRTCLNECKCRNGSYCHPVTGVCWCERGWTGEDCSVSLNEGYFAKQMMKEEYSGSHSSSIVAGICVPIALILLTIIASIVYYKKRSFRNGDNLTLPPSKVTYDVLSED